ncbi:LacI family DNA-binding transcriptional regulator [Evansella tamaricis]|uniref:LacI family transcriptional regulator n=1 Tax=Evansella tamaricis TaxID=2069301 RepID=A0ABS6JDQ6_9BACI|nr:LacI family DNA-binding transcriptional regulator [Evansella tamaricis]MBU9711618.1 LacI family transcriptional regulator [Evansella tamaricis]
MGVTIKDIAKHAGVSYSTVSKALLNSPLVKEDTKKKVVTIAKELGYQPNAAARSLVSKKSNTIGVVWPNVERPVHASLITKINKRLDDLNYTTLMSINNICDAVNTFNRFQVDAILVFDGEGATNYFSSKVPVVVYGLKNDENPYPIVDVNRKFAIKSAVHYFHEIGHKKISYIGDLPVDSFQLEKVTGFKEALAECQLKHFEHSILSVEGLNQHDGYLATKKLLESGDKPTAIISGSNDLSKGALRAISESNLKIPEDISIISYDNLPQKEGVSVPLSIVGVPLDKITEKLTDTLIDVINQKEVERSIILSPEIKITESCERVQN